MSYPHQKDVDGISMPRGFGDVILSLDHGRRASVCHACNDIVPADTDRVVVWSNGKRYKFRNGSRRGSKWFLHVQCVQTILNGAQVEELNRNWDNQCFHCKETIPKKARYQAALSLKTPYVHSKLCFACSLLPMYRYCHCCNVFYLRRETSKMVMSDSAEEDMDSCYICNTCVKDGYGMSEKMFAEQKAADEALKERYEMLMEKAEKGEFFDG